MILSQRERERERERESPKSEVPDPQNQAFVVRRLFHLMTKCHKLLLHKF